MREIQVKVKIPVPEAVYRFSVWIALKYRRVRYGYAFRRIRLTQGKFAIVDPEDYQRLLKFRWYAKVQKNATYAIGYKNSNSKHTFMHRLIMNTPANLVCDHINHDGLDNRKANLRNCSIRQNTANRRPLRNTYSKYKGVTWNKRKKKIAANIKSAGRKIHLGYFNNERDAALAYDMAAREKFGEFAFLNFPKKKNKKEIRQNSEC